MKKTDRTWLLSLILIMGAAMMFAISCKDDEETPSLITSVVSRITDNSASSGGEVTDEGTSAVTARGVCWNTSASPTVNNSNTIDGADTGTFVSSLTGLTANTKYYVRAYATNDEGTTYGNEVTFTTPATVTDVDGNVYHTVIIGTQVWMAENLKVTRYRDLTWIPNVADNTEWMNQTTGAYCQYGDGTYGMHYNAYAVFDSRGLAPQGWHVPTDAEFKTLEGNVDSQFPAGNPEWDNPGERGSDAGENLKETGTAHWAPPNTGATDQFGFKALPGGYRDWVDGQFYDLQGRGGWWCSTPLDDSRTWTRSVWATSKINRTSLKNQTGGTVRCVKDY